MINTYIITKVFMFFLFTKALIQAYLDLRNEKYVAAHSKEVPAAFDHIISSDDHSRAAKYTIQKSRVERKFRTLNLLILLGWTLGGGLDYLEEFLHVLTASYQLGTIQHGVIYVAIFSLINMVLDLPHSIYFTFGIEEKFGFNKTTPKLFCLDLFKGLILGAIIGLPLFALILWLMESLKDSWWLYAFFALTLFQIIMMWAYPVLLAPIFNKFTPLEDENIKNEIQDLLKQTDFKTKGVFVMDASRRSSHGNAYFTGFGKAKRIVFFDNLIKALSAGEIKAILAHELGHFKKKHIHMGIALSLVSTFIGLWILGYAYKSPLFLEAHGLNRITPHTSLILFSLVVPIYTYFLTPLFNIFSRKNEFAADAFATQLVAPEMLKSALAKLYKDNASTLTPDPAYSYFYYSHPPALERIIALESSRPS